MGLIRPNSPDWAYCTDNYPAALDSSDLGATVVPGTDDSDGAAVSLFSSALTHDVEKLLLRFSCTNPPAATDNSMLATILIDPAGGTSWATLIPFLIVNPSIMFLNITDAPARAAVEYEFPLWIPAGASLGVQMRSAGGSVPTGVHVTALAFGGNANPASWWCGQRVSAIAIDPSISTGQSHTPGSNDSFSAWANLGDPLAQPAHAFQWGVNGVFNSATYFVSVYQFEFGVSGNRIGGPFIKGISSAEVGTTMGSGIQWKSLPAGAQLQVRAKCNTGALSLGVGAYAVH